MGSLRSPWNGVQLFLKFRPRTQPRYGTQPRATSRIEIEIGLPKAEAVFATRIREHEDRQKQARLA